LPDISLGATKWTRSEISVQLSLIYFCRFVDAFNVYFRLHTRITMT